MEDISFQFLLSACSTLNYPSPWNVFPRGVTKCNHWIAVWARLEHRSVCNKTHRQSSPQKSWTEKQLQNCLVCVAETVTIKLRTPIKWSLLIVSGTQQLWQTKIIRTTTCILQGDRICTNHPPKSRKTIYLFRRNLGESKNLDQTKTRASFHIHSRLME